MVTAQTPKLDTSEAWIRENWAGIEEKGRKLSLHIFLLLSTGEVFVSREGEASILVSNPYEHVDRQIFIQRGTDITFQIENALNRLLQKGITVPHPSEIRDYLIRYQDMIGLLLSVCKSVRERFGTNAQLSLEVYHDPEIEDEYLTLYVRQEKYDDNILDVIEDISTQYEDELVNKSGWLLVTTDFLPLQKV